MGEVTALVLLLKGLHSLLTGRPSPAMLGVAGIFLIVWLAFWTFGGVMAIREVLRLLWAEDRLALEYDGLTRTHRLGPFTFTRRLARQEIHRVFTEQTKLMATAGNELMELTDLGTADERGAAAQQLRVALGLPDEVADLAALPDAWQEVTGPRGERLLVPNLQTRRKQALVVSVITSFFWTVAALLAWRSLGQPELWVLTIMVSMLAIWLARQTVWLRRGRKEWRLERGKLVWQRRFGDAVTELAEARALELTESTDSDGDRRYELRAIEMSAPAYTRVGKVRQHVPLQSALHDPVEARCLGRWLAQQTTVPFHDRVPTETDRQAERDRLREQLANSGKLGRLLARLVKR